MTRSKNFLAFSCSLILRHANARSLHFSNLGSLSRDPSLTKLSHSRPLTTAALAVDLVGGGSGSGSVSMVRKQKEVDERHNNSSDSNSNPMRIASQTEKASIREASGSASALGEYEELEEPKSSDLNSTPLRISSRNGKNVIKESRKDIRLQKRLDRQRRKAEKKSHRMIAKTLKNRNHLNLSRKVVHAGFGLFFAGLNHLLPREKFVPGMAWLTGATLMMELLRYRKGFGWMNDVLHFFLGGSLRKHEMEGKFTGSFYYFLGVTITAASFPTSCASLGICQLALADPSASFFGRQTKDIYWSRIEK